MILHGIRWKKIENSKPEERKETSLQNFEEPAAASTKQQSHNIPPNRSNRYEHV